jgi:hypothetical protein
MIGIVVLNYRTPEKTIECVDSILKYTKKEFRVYVVDNHSEDGSFDRLKDYYIHINHICIISSNENGGYSKGNNIGIRRAVKDGAESIAVINSDVVLLNDAIDILYDNLFSNDDIGLVGPSILYNNNEQQFARRKLDLKGFIYSKKPFYWISKNYSRNSYRNICWDKRAKLFIFPGMVSGCCFLIKSDIFKQIGFFDENIFLFHEEDVIAYKLEKISKKVGIVTDAKISHEESSSVGKNGLVFSRYHRVISSLYVLRVYAKLSRFKMVFPIITALSPFFLYSIFSKRYRSLCKNLYQQIREIIKINPPYNYI